MDVTRIAVEHVRNVADRPFEKVTETFERDLFLHHAKLFLSGNALS